MTVSQAYTIQAAISGAGTVTLGTVQTNVYGGATLKVQNPAAVLPASKTVKDITTVQILTSGGTVVAQGNF